MKPLSPTELGLSLAWEFTEVLPGDFSRDRPAVRDKRFPVLGPRPDGPSTQPRENAGAKGPFLYFVYGSSGDINYIGKADERTVLYRWIRPDGRTGLHQWSHGTNSATKKATIEFIAEELRSGRSPVRLYFSAAESLRSELARRAAVLPEQLTELNALSSVELIDQMEHYLIYKLQPVWNVQRRIRPPVGLISRCGDYWVKE